MVGLRLAMGKTPVAPIAPSLSFFGIGASETTETVEVTLNSVCANSPTQYMASESPDFAGATVDAVRARGAVHVVFRQWRQDRLFQNPKHRGPIGDAKRHHRTACARPRYRRDHHVARRGAADNSVVSSGGPS